MVSATIKRHEDNYNKIIKFYDLAEDLIQAVESDKNPEALLDLVEPLIDRIEKSTDVLAEEYRAYVKSGKRFGIFGKLRVERAMGNLKYAVTEFNKLQNRGKKQL